MPEISLRAYGREIDELVERERLEEAIAHCRYILQTYPKHLETYRLLGKAYLEAKRYGDAADIFQRVLSAVPDDFVSHVGMAIVREDEGNLDAAIWHMKRAFETNPSNPAIQQEMKRLIGRRDGLEPHKVRLTRGALARMYAHGELYAQAIDELRSKLQEDADRPDLQVLLAKMYWQTDQRSEATAIANQILEKLPYCAEANRILAANLQARDRIEEAAVYHRRLANLDPYAAFVESALIDASSVEENAVLIEKLDWEAGEPLPSGAPGQPGWAATLGMEMRESSDEVVEEPKPAQTGPLPSWLEPGEPPPFEAAAEKELRAEMEQEGVGKFEEDVGEEFLDQSEDAESSAALDDEAGDEPDRDEVFELPAEGSDREGPGASGMAMGMAAEFIASEEEEQPQEEMEPEPTEPTAPDDDGESIAERELEADEPTIADAAEIGAAAGMFDQIEAEDSGDGEISADESSPEEAIAEPTEDIAKEPDLRAESVEQEPAAESEIPDWMQEAGWTESTGEVAEGPVSFSDQELDALAEGQLIDDGAGDEEDSDLTPAELPDWIHDIAPEDEAEGIGDESLPTWIGAEAPEESEEPIAETLDAGPEAEATGSDGEAESFPAADPDTSELPTWITEEPPGATETIVTWLEDKGSEAGEEEIAETSELPDWMRDTGPLQDTLEPESTETEIEEPAPELEAAIEPEPTLTEPEEEPPESMEPAAEEPEPGAEGWLSAVAAVAAEDDTEEPKADAPSTPDWLAEAMEGLGDEKGVDHGPGIAAAVGMMAGDGEDDEPEARDAEAPDSVDTEGVPTREAAPEPEQPAAPVSDLAADASPPSEPEADVEPAVGRTPDWLEEIGTRPQERAETDTAEWLDGLEADGEAVPAQPDSETPDWLKGLADEGAEADTSGAAPAPDWLREIGEPGSVAQDAEAETAEADQQVAAEGMSAAPDWLEGIGEGEDQPDYVAPQPEIELEPEPEIAPEPIDEAQDETPPVAAEEDSEVMEWLEDLAAKQAETPDEDEIVSAAPAAAAATPVLEDREIPDEPEEGLEWLEHLADQRGMDVDVALPEQPPPTDSTSEAEAAPEPESELDTAPGWLDRMATQPIPAVDLEALEAATRGEEVSPEAETIKASRSEVQAHLEEDAAPEIADVGEQPEVTPDDVTIEARAGDLQAEMEAAEAAAEPEEKLVPPDDEVPAWLIAAAGQPEEQVVEEPEANGAAEEPEEPPSEALSAETHEPEEILQEEITATAGGEAASEPGDLLADEEQPAAEESAQELEAQPLAPEVKIDEEPPVPEFEEPDAAEEEMPEEAPAAPEEPAAAEEKMPEEAPEAPREVDQLEQSRQALASGETEAALKIYGELIKRREALDSVIEDLRLAADRSPDNADLWQVLGDAYMRDDQTDEAIDAYRKGMEAA